MRKLVMITVLLTLAHADDYYNGLNGFPNTGIQYDIMSEDSRTGKDTLWNRFRLLKLDGKGELIYGDIARYEHTNGPGGYEERMGLRVPLMHDSYKGFMTFFGNKSAAFNGAGMNFHGCTDHWVVGGEFEGAETTEGKKWLLGMHIGPRFETESGKASLVMGYHNLDGSSIGTLYYFHEGPDNWEYGVGAKKTENDNCIIGYSIGEKSPRAFEGVTWRIRGHSDFDGSYSVKTTWAFDPHPHYKPSGYGYLNPYDGITSVSLVDSVMDFPGIYRHERARKLVIELGYDRNKDSGDLLYAGTSIYPLRFLGKEISRFKPHIDIDWNQSTAAHTGNFKAGGGILFDIAGKGKESTTGLLDVGAFTDTDNIVTWYIQAVIGF